MKILVVYFSRTGITGILCDKICEVLRVKGYEVNKEEIKSFKSYKGIIGIMRAFLEVSGKKMPEIHPLKERVEDYDFVFIGTPIWAYTMASPIRTFLAEYGNTIKRSAFFCTMGEKGDQAAFSQMGNILKTAPKAMLALTSVVVKNETKEMRDKIEKFIAEIGEKE